MINVANTSSDSPHTKANRRSPAIILPPSSSPPSAGPTPYPKLGRMFSTDPARNVGQPGFTQELRALPDDQLIAVLVQLGAPRWFAENIRHHPHVRFMAVSVWCLVKDAEEGRHVTNALTGETLPAREVVDMIRAQYTDARKAELVSDTPENTTPIGT